LRDSADDYISKNVSPPRWSMKAQVGRGCEEVCAAMTNALPVSKPVPFEKALIIDSDPDTSDLYALLLGALAADIQCLDDGRIALARGLANAPELIITDACVRFIDGFELCRLFKKDRATAQVPILITSSQPGPGELERARQAGADAVLLKPLSLDTFVAVIRGLADGSVGDDKRLVPRPVVPARVQYSPIGRPSGHSTKVRTHDRRQTATPPLTPPALWCPQCDQVLLYQRSQIGGVNEQLSEQWDYFMCSNSCGEFQYRHRTRSVRHLG
jgi:CheY-like chemotaxis protein